MTWETIPLVEIPHRSVVGVSRLRKAFIGSIFGPERDGVQPFSLRCNLQGPIRDMIA